MTIWTEQIKLVVNTYLARLMFMSPPQRSRIVVPDDDEESLNSVGQLFRDAEMPSSQSPYHHSPDIALSTLVTATTTTPNQTGPAVVPNVAVSESSRKLEKIRIGVPPRTTVNGTIGTTRQGSDPAPSSQRDRVQERSSRSLLANVLDLDDDF
ncbi:unnamed protein product, partial [Echinostoma caproni]|uniref:Uncharacterized protein n=1 Tax=Echinostoma caproni TaxID=27848 RepID=A0A183B5U1_9TREM